MLLYQSNVYFCLFEREKKRNKLSSSSIRLKPKGSENGRREIRRFARTRNVKVYGEKIGKVYIYIFLMAGNRGISPGVYEIPARRRLAKFIIPPPHYYPPLLPSSTLSVNVAAFKSLQFTSGYYSNFSSPFSPPPPPFAATVYHSFRSAALKLVDRSRGALDGTRTRRTRGVPALV